MSLMCVFALLLQTMQSELKVAQHKQQQWQLATDAVLASLQLDAEQLRGRVDDMQQNTKQAIDELRISLSLQADAHRQDVEQQVQVQCLGQAWSVQGTPLSIYDYRKPNNRPSA